MEQKKEKIDQPAPTFREQDEVEVTEKKTLRRFTLKDLISGAFDALLLNRGLWVTFLALLQKPGKRIHEYLDIERQKLMRPAQFFLISLGIYVFFAFAFSWFEGANQSSLATFAVEPENNEAREVQKSVASYLTRYFNFWVVIALFFYAAAARLLFSSRSYNLAEHLIIHTYIVSEIYLLSFPLLILYGLIGQGKDLFFLLEFGVGWGYITYAYSQIFSLSVFKALIFSSLLIIISFLCFGLFGVIIGVSFSLLS
jgi:hypothetical protein